METKNPKILAASALGTAAFKAGKPATPCLDRELRKLLAGNEIGEGLSILNAWSSAWHVANVRHPVI